MQTRHLTTGFIGLGLIGGSIARALKKRAPSKMCIRDSLYGLQNTHPGQFCLFGGGIPVFSGKNCIGAVSYTHLDVYKRQASLIIPVRYWDTLTALG